MVTNKIHSFFSHLFSHCPPTWCVQCRWVWRLELLCSPQSGIYPQPLARTAAGSGGNRASYPRDPAFIWKVEDVFSVWVKINFNIGPIFSSLVSRDNVYIWPTWTKFHLDVTSGFSRLSLWCIRSWIIIHYIVWLCCLQGCNPGPLLALLDGWLLSHREMGSRDGASKSQHFRFPLLQKEICI